MAELRPPRCIRFGNFTVNEQSGELSECGRRVPLQQKPFQLLTALLERSGEIVTREELQKRLWPEGVFVDHEAGLNTAVRKLREALGDAPTDPRFVETVPRVGYRFIAPTRGSSRRLRLVAMVSVVAVLIAALGLLSHTVSRRDAADSAPTNEAARRAYLEGLYHKAQQTPAAFRRAIESLERATELEPDHAPSWGQLAECRAIRWFIGGNRQPGEIARVRREAERALRLDRSQPVALRTTGLLSLHVNLDFETAGRLLTRAAALDNRSPESHLTLATWLSVVGRHDEAIEAVRRAIELDPASYVVKSDAGFFLLRADRPHDAVVECKRALRLAPDFAPALGCLMEAHRRLGNEQDYRRETRRYLVARDATKEELEIFETSSDPVQAFSRWELSRLDEMNVSSPIRRATHYAVLGDRSSAVKWLETAYEERHPQLVFLTSNRALDALNGDTRFQRLLERIGLTQLTRPGRS